jgi:hypothetical protein
MRQGPTPRQIAELTRLFGVSRRTIARWQVFWQEIFSQTPFWKIARGRLVPVVEIDSLPRALTEAFLGSGELEPAWGKLLRFLSPITIKRDLFIEGIG